MLHLVHSTCTLLVKDSRFRFLTGTKAKLTLHDFEVSKLSNQSAGVKLHKQPLYKCCFMTTFVDYKSVRLRPYLHPWLDPTGYSGTLISQLSQLTYLDFSDNSFFALYLLPFHLFQTSKPSLSDPTRSLAQSLYPLPTLNLLTRWTFLIIL